MSTEDWRDRLAALRGDMEPDNEQCETPAPVEAEVHQGRLDIVYEKKGRAGKPATIICGFTIGDEKVEALASRLKKRMGCGGSARGGEILLQGDRRREAAALLADEGFKSRIL